MTTTTEKTPENLITEQMTFEDERVARALYGQRDENLRVIEQQLDLEIGTRGTLLHIKGAPSDVHFARHLIEQLYTLAIKGQALGHIDVKRSVEMLHTNPELDLVSIFTDKVYISANNKQITPKTPMQKAYIDTIRNNELVFGIGPAGTGKTYLAVAMALHAFQEKRVKRIILTRPAVEAGERLGFLPGDLTEKVNPYLRPLLDAIGDLFDAEKAQRLMEKNIIEIAPLAFMRGRTLNDAFIILDEAQNTTREQMKMFLTRMGFNSRAVVTGDISQIDLPRRRDSGLIEAQRVLKNIPGIGVIHFTDVDVVRHSLVQKIIRAYEADAVQREEAYQTRKRDEEGKARTSA